VSVKVGEAYVEIFPEINRAFRQRAVAAVAKDMRDVYDRASNEELASTRRTVRETTNSRIGGINRVRDANRSAAREEDTLFKRLLRHGQEHEGILHKMATQFRTIGTLVRGIGVTSAVLSSWGALQLTIGGIVSTLPLIQAGLALIPGALSVAAAEGIILKSAFFGIGTALSASGKSAQAFQTAMEKLAPAARRFVLVLLDAKKALPNIQQEFFSAPQLIQAEGRLRGFAQRISPALKNLARTSGQVFGSLVANATSLRNVALINTILAKTSFFIKTITPGLNSVVNGFLKLAAAGAGQGAKGLNTLLTRLGNFLGRVDVQKLFDNAKGALHAFASVGKDVLDIITGIGRAMGGASGLSKAFFSTFGGGLDAIAKFVNSGTGQTFLRELFDVLGVLSSLAGAVIANALKFLAGLLHNLHPAIKPFADVVKKLLKDLAPLGGLIGTVLADAMKWLTDKLKDLEPVLKKVVKWLIDHPDEVRDMAAAVLAAYAAFASLKKAVAGVNALTVAWNVLNASVIASPIGATLFAVTAFFIALGAAVVYTYNKSELFRRKVKELVDKLKGLWKAVSDLADAFGIDLGPILKDVIPAALTGIIFGLIMNIQLLTNAVKIATSVVGGLKVAFNSIGNFLTKTVPSWFSGLASSVVARFNDIKNRIHQAATSDWAPWNLINRFLTKTAPSWYRALRDWVNARFNDIRLRIFRAATSDWAPWNLINRFLTKTVPSWYKAVRDWINARFNDIKNRIRQAATGDWGPFAAVNRFLTKTVPSWYRFLKDAVNARFNDIKARILQAATGDWGPFSKIKTFITKTVPSWFGTFRDLVAGVFNDITRRAKGMINNVISIVTSNWGRMGRAWIGLFNAIAKPVKDLIDKVYTQGIKKFWDEVATKVGLKALKALSFFNPFSHADGGLVAAKGVARFSAGGYLRPNGAGGPTQDNVPAWLSQGEFVVNARSTRRLAGDFGMDFLHWMNRYGISNGGRTKAPPIVDDDLRHSRGGLIRGFASGGYFGASGPSWRQIIAFQHALGPGLRVTSTTGGGHAPHSWHYAGQAVDFAGATSAMNAAAARLMRYAGAMREMFHSPSWFVKNGRKSHPIDYATHFNHVHLAMSQAGVAAAMAALKSGKPLGPASGGFGHLTGILGKIQDMKGQMTAFFLNPVRAIIRSLPGGEGWGLTPAQIAKIKTDPKHQALKQNALNKFFQMRNQLGDNAAVGATQLLQKKLDEAIKEAEAAAAAFGGGGSVANRGQIIAWIKQASQYTSIPASWYGPLLTLIGRESGGNPRSINRYDVNARRGIPSQGLMQVIPPTYYAYGDPRLAARGILDPVGNIVAGVNYIRARYGTIFNVQQANASKPPKGYWFGGTVRSFDTGGILPPGLTMAYNGTRANEYVTKEKPGLPEKLVVELTVDDFTLMMDARIAKHENDVIRYIVTH